MSETTGCIDLIAVKDKEIKRIDVKSSTKKTRTDKQKKEGVVLLIFDRRSRQCKFVEHRNENR